MEKWGFLERKVKIRAQNWGFEEKHGDFGERSEDSRRKMGILGEKW